MSLYSLQLYPDLQPRMVDPLWFDVDRPVDMNAELKELEQQEKGRLLAIQQHGKDILPIGKATHDNSDDDDDDANDDDYDDDDNVDDEEEDDDSEMNDDYSEAIE
ncbi:hypothetical protein HAZT_HAZT000679 [Hyalella azteca]|uniref:Anaphase-promoting complex subunit 15-like n=1 Tax=Hyalella azteca TaxID=294128 RepID=A0A6A0GW45_HYAAZ|nr:anaphase-promoting complex subunit 15-like [Hyalella azteca]KAA0188587.1 hypothetical protein HAZT_HAZT000679 [Hyalella azteca]